MKKREREDFIGRCSGQAHIRRERWQWLENDHRNPEKKKRKHQAQKKNRHCKHSPQKKRNGDTTLGYSERTALRREQCGRNPKSRSSGLNSEESFPRQRNETIACLPRYQLGEPLSTTVNPSYHSTAGVSDTTQI
jgi:hypothetical protein